MSYAERWFAAWFFPYSFPEDRNEEPAHQEILTALLAQRHDEAWCQVWLAWQPANEDCFVVSPVLRVVTTDE